LVICNLNFSSVIWGFKQTPRKWMSGCIECRWICPSRFVYMLIFSSVIWGFKQTPGKWMLGCIECRWICPSRFVHMFIFFNLSFGGFNNIPEINASMLWYL
jgi:hypothetical protein